MDRKGIVRDSVALVTGASAGLGKALSVELARRGARVVMVARDEARLARAAAEVAAVGGPEPVPLALDVADKQAIHPLGAIAAELGGRDVDLLFHNASSLGPVPMPLLFDLDCEELEAVFATNVVGPFRLTKLVGGSMALCKRGTIVFVSSDAAVSGYPGWGAYGASKAAADQLMRVLAAELAIHGVRVFSVDPTDMDTAMHAAAIPDADPSTLARPEVIARRIVDMVELPGRAPSGARLVASEDLAGAVA
ncbi:MAG: SDR family oxidoreductase [Polyangiaceae bacterium]